MPKKQYTSVPTNYAVCIHTDCPMAKGCLHQIAYQQLLPERTFMRLVNPQKCEKSAQCPFFRDSTPQKYAKGFTKFQKRMFPEQYEKFSKLLIAEFGRNPYYERRRGDYLPRNSYWSSTRSEKWVSTSPWSSTTTWKPSIGTIRNLWKATPRLCKTQRLRTSQ